MAPEYDDFCLIVQGLPDHYIVEARAPGEINVAAPFHLQDQSKIYSALAQIERGDTLSAEQMQGIGRSLFEALFPRPILRAFDQAQATLQKGHHLRIKLTARPPELAYLPWELLYDPDEGRFLTAQLTYPLVRFVESWHPAASIRADHPLRVLYVQANVRAHERLELSASEQALREALGDQAELHVLHHASTRDLREALRSHPGYHLLHFDGHAAFDTSQEVGMLYLQDEQGHAEPLDGEMLATLLEGTSIRVVVLTACQSAVDSQKSRYTGLAQQLMRASALPAVIAMQFAIPDPTALAFNRGFYRAIASGYPLDAATVEGRKEILSQYGGYSPLAFSVPDWAAPVLFMRSRDGFILPKPVIKMARAGPFMADTLPKDFVPRPTESKALIEALVGRGQSARVAITAALRGAGGYGKTTLAHALCHDLAVRRAFPDGILWLTLGENPGDLTSKLVPLIRALSSPTEPGTPFSDLDAALQRLGELLEKKKVLLVIDDVWQHAHLKPLLSERLNCARLITTRNNETLPRHTLRINVDAMQLNEAVALLGMDLPSGQKGRLGQLAIRLGEWPLLLKLVNKFLYNLVREMGLDLEAALDEAESMLTNLGLTAFDDPSNPDERNRAAAATIRASLRLLRREAHYGRIQVDEYHCYHQLAIFPKDVDIPLSTLGRLWELEPQVVNLLCLRFHQLSLLLAYDYDQQTIRLHDVVRTFLVESQAGSLTKSHQHFLRRYRLSRWAELPAEEPYLWHHLPYHLTEAGQRSTLELLLLDFAWLQGKLLATDIHALLLDFAWVPKHAPLQQVARTLRQAAHILATDPRQLAGQLLGRLLNDRSNELQPLLLQARQHRTDLWLRPLTASLHEPAEIIRTLSGHQDWVRAVVVTDDGRLALSASHDKTIKIWELSSGREVRTLAGQGGWINSVAVSGDGRVALSASSSERQIKVWNLEDGQLLHTLEGHEAPVNDIALTPDGLLALSASHDRTLKLWNVQQGTLIHTLKGHEGWVRAAAITPNGRFALSAAQDKSLRFWDLIQGQELRTLQGHEASVQSVALNPEGRFALSGSADKSVRLWDLRSGQVLRVLRGHTAPVTAVLFFRNWRRALSASTDKTLRVWDLATGQTVRTLVGHSASIHGVALTPDGRRALSASADKTLKVWDLASAENLSPVAGHTDTVRAVCLTPNSRLVLSTSVDGTIKVWDASSGREVHTFAGHEEPVNALAVTADGAQIISASADNSLKLWDIRSGHLLRTFVGHIDWVRGVTISPNGRLALSASSDTTIKWWNLSNGQLLRTLYGHTGWVNDVALTPDGRFALSASDDHTLRFWDLASGESPYTLAGHEGWVMAVAIAPDGRHALSASQDGTLRLWNLANGKEVATLSDHTDWVTDVVFCPDNRLALSASQDKTLKIWDLESRQVLATFHTDGALHSCAIGQDGKTVVAGGASGRVHLFRLEAKR